MATFFFCHKADYNMKINFWFLGSFIISVIVVIPILTVFSSFFQGTSDYFEILKETFFFEYVFNSLTLLVGVLILTFILDFLCKAINYSFLQIHKDQLETFLLL